MISLAESVRLLRPAVEREGEATIEWVLSKVKRDEFQLWRGEKSAIVTVAYEAGAGRILMWLYAGGDLQEIQQGMKPEIEAWARSVGCIRATMLARKGWSRVLTDYTAKPQIALFKEL